MENSNSYQAIEETKQAGFTSFQRELRETAGERKARLLRELAEAFESAFGMEGK